MNKFLKYKGKVYRAVDNLDEEAARKVQKSINEVKSSVSLWSGYIDSWVKAYQKSDFAQCNSIKHKLSASVGKIDMLALSGEILPLLKV